MDWSSMLIDLAVALASTVIGTIIATWATSRLIPVTPAPAPTPTGPPGNHNQVAIGVRGDSYQAGTSIEIDRSRTVIHNYNTTINGARKAGTPAEESLLGAGPYFLAAILAMILAVKYLEHVLLFAFAMMLVVGSATVVLVARSRRVWGGLPPSARFVIATELLVALGLATTWTAASSTELFGWTIWDVNDRLQEPPLVDQFLPWRDVLDQLGGGFDGGFSLLVQEAVGVGLSTATTVLVALDVVCWTGALRQAHPNHARRRTSARLARSFDEFGFGRTLLPVLVLLALAYSFANGWVFELMGKLGQPELPGPPTSA